jgi:hypothetical protein
MSPLDKEQWALNLNSKARLRSYTWDGGWFWIVARFCNSKHGLFFPVAAAEQDRRWFSTFAPCQTQTFGGVGLQGIYILSAARTPIGRLGGALPWRVDRYTNLVYTIFV